MKSIVYKVGDIVITPDGRTGTVIGASIKVVTLEFEIGHRISFYAKQLRYKKPIDRLVDKYDMGIRKQG